MAGGKVSYKITGLDRWMKAVADPPKFYAYLGQNMRKASELNGKLGERFMRKAIQSGNLAPNADLTVFIKSSSKPLVDKGDLFKSINSRIIDDYTVFCGVLKASDFSNIARIIHEGVVIQVTPAMRGMFLFLFKASIGEMDPSKLTGRAAELWGRQPGGWKPLRESTVAIVIPPRPWATIVFADAEFKAKVGANWHAALAKTYRDMVQQQ